MKYLYKGSAEMEMNVPQEVYYPREDTEMLAAAIEKMEVKGRKALEMGCGSGLLSILMAKKGAKATAIDINPLAVAATEENAIINGVDVDVFVSDMFERVTGAFDLIVFNPPYLPVEENEPSDLTYDGGLTGRELIEIFLDNAISYLNKDGKLLFVISTLTGEQEVMTLVKEAGFTPSITGRQKLDWEELVVIEARV